MIQTHADASRMHLILQIDRKATMQAIPQAEVFGSNRDSGGHTIDGGAKYHNLRPATH
jgi:hypothetical protein